MRCERHHIFAAALLATIAVTSAACQHARVPQPLTGTQLGKNDDDAQFEFWHRLPLRPRTCNDEAFHGLLLYLDDADPATSYEQRIATLKSRKLLPANFDRPADEAVERGVLAVTVSRILDVKGGLMMHLVGRQNPRYALLELQDMGVFPLSSENQSFTGSEFVGIIGRMEDFRHGDSSELPATVLHADAGGSAQKPR